MEGITQPLRVMKHFVWAETQPTAPLVQPVAPAKPAWALDDKWGSTVLLNRVNKIMQSQRDRPCADTDVQI